MFDCCTHGSCTPLVAPLDARQHAQYTHTHNTHTQGAKPITASGRPALLDAPATGGVVAAEAGALTFCVGAADEKDLEAARPLLALLGGHVTFCGPVGAGSVAKLVR